MYDEKMFQTYYCEMINYLIFEFDPFEQLLNNKTQA